MPDIYLDVYFHKSFCQIFPKYTLTFPRLEGLEEKRFFVYLTLNGNLFWYNTTNGCWSFYVCDFLCDIKIGVM